MQLPTPRFLVKASCLQLTTRNFLVYSAHWTKSNGDLLDADRSKRKLIEKLIEKLIATLNEVLQWKVLWGVQNAKLNEGKMKSNWMKPNADCLSALHLALDEWRSIARSVCWHHWTMRYIRTALIEKEANDSELAGSPMLCKSIRQHWCIRQSIGVAASLLDEENRMGLWASNFKLQTQSPNASEFKA